LEQLILSHCGEDAFDETVKLLLVKLYDEQTTAGRSSFISSFDAESTAARINRLFSDAIRSYPGLYPAGERISQSY